MRIQFFSRGPIDQVSGGFIYNRLILEYLKTHKVDVTYYSRPGSLSDSEPDAIAIIDSLIIPGSMDQLMRLPSQPLLLMHMGLADDFVATSDFAALVRRSRLLATGEGTRAWLRDAAADSSLDIALIEPGVPGGWARYDRSSSTAHRLLCLANYVQGKRHDRLLNVMNQLRDLPWTLQLHGNNDLDPECFEGVRQKVRELELQDRVQVDGAIPHECVPEKMRAADLLLQLSDNESYSMVTAEAIACGLPVLSSKTGNWKVFEESKRVHYLRSDEPDECVSVLQAMIQDAEFYGQFSSANSVVARNWDDAGQEFLALLQSFS